MVSEPSTSESFNVFPLSQPLVISYIEVGVLFAAAIGWEMTSICFLQDSTILRTLTWIKTWNNTDIERISIWKNVI